MDKTAKQNQDSNEQILVKHLETSMESNKFLESSTETLHQIPNILEAILLHLKDQKMPSSIPVSLKGVETVTLKGDKGEDGKTPEKGKDYMTDAEKAEFIKKVQNAIKMPEDGKTPQKGVDYLTQSDVNEFLSQVRKMIKDGEPGKDGETPDMNEIIARVLPLIKPTKGEKGDPGEKGKDGTSITGSEMISKIKEAGGFDYDDLKNTPDISLMLRQSGTGERSPGGPGFLYEVSDVMIPKTGPNDGDVLVWNKTIQKWISAPQSGGGGAVWGSITGNITDQSDLQTELAGKASETGSPTQVRYFDTSGNDSSDANFTTDGNSDFNLIRFVTIDDAGRLKFDSTEISLSISDILDSVYKSKLSLQTGAASLFYVDDIANTLTTFVADSTQAQLYWSDNSTGNANGISAENDGLHILSTDGTSQFNVIWPNSNGLMGQFLQTDGSNTLSFANISPTDLIGTPTHIPYYDPSTGELTDDINFTTDGSSNFNISREVASGQIVTENISDNVIGFGIRGFGLTSNDGSTTLDGIFGGDFTAIGGASHQVFVGVNDPTFADPIALTEYTVASGSGSLFTGLSDGSHFLTMQADLSNGWVLQGVDLLSTTPTLSVNDQNNHNLLQVFNDGTIEINNEYTLPRIDAVTPGQVMTSNAIGQASWEDPVAGIPMLLENQVAFGDASNLQTSSANFQTDAMTFLEWSGGTNGSSFVIDDTLEKISLFANEIYLGTPFFTVGTGVAILQDDGTGQGISKIGASNASAGTGVRVLFYGDEVFELSMSTGDLIYIDSSANEFSLFDFGPILSIDVANRVLYDNSGTESIYWQGRVLTNDSSATTLDWENYAMFDSSTSPSVYWNGRELMDNSGTVVSLNWENRILVNSSGVTTLDWENRRLDDEFGDPIVFWGHDAISLGVTGQSQTFLFGGQVVEVKVIAADTNYSLIYQDYIVEMHQATTNVTATLPLNPTIGETHIIKVKEKALHNVVVNGNGKNIEGSSTDTMTGSLTSEPSRTYTYNGTEWSIY